MLICAFAAVGCASITIHTVQYNPPYELLTEYSNELSRFCESGAVSPQACERQWTRLLELENSLTRDEARRAARLLEKESGNDKLRELARKLARP